MEVAMGYHTVKPATLQYVPQRHAICTTTHAYQYSVALLQQLLITDIFYYAAQHFLSALIYN
jgi:hypothetical protein